MEDETTAFEEIKNDIGEGQLMDESSEYNETISEEIMHVFNYNVLEYVVQGYFMPVVSLFGLAGNTVSIYILSHKDVKLKKDFSKVRWHTYMASTFQFILQNLLEFFHKQLGSSGKFTHLSSNCWRGWKTLGKSITETISYGLCISMKYSKIYSLWC